MGCDIHVFVERKIDGEWQSLDKWEQDDDYCYVENEIFSDRNYQFFPFLGDARNSDSIQPIAAHRGTPEVVSAPVKKYMDYYGCDLHSKSWISFRELLEADWDQEFNMTRMVKAEHAKNYRESGWKPDSWCSYTTQKDYESLTWTSTIRSQCVRQLADLQKIYKMCEGDIDNTRVVFAFDN